MNEMAKPIAHGKFCSGCEWPLTSWCMECGAPLCITKVCPRARLRCHPIESKTTGEVST